jgi:hypothetical protein
MFPLSSEGPAAAGLQRDAWVDILANTNLDAM